MLHDNKPKYSMDAIWYIIFDYARSEKWVNSHKKEIAEAIVQNLNYRPNMSYDWRLDNVGRMSVATLIEMCEACDADIDIQSSITGQAFSAVDRAETTLWHCEICKFVQDLSRFEFKLRVNGTEVDLFGDFVNMVHGGRRKAQ